ncbi:MAG: glycine cleavage system aminomethyltransferase GcvT [Candidatus Fermentibacteraceae bacterium]|nr:glycine cleavage system aminomethyltransferase GcvT [Candidatus Fermentibacteraceae bacterium]MBN2609576.1 glycine cleavage system aminomethyltransferase GcvT [Candidatus Fermentibacteraceae bacterium]
MNKKTALYDRHVSLGARMEPFAGYIMPIKYTSVQDEHNTVRKGVGIFDLSHMGEFRVRGGDACRFLDYLLTNDADVEAGQAYYSTMCYPDGGIVDDLIVYRISRDEYLMVVNASNIEKDWAWVNNHTAGYSVDLTNESDDTALVAVQGPDSEKVVQMLTDTDLSAIEYYHHVSGEAAGRKALIARTGYTGEDGFELYLKPGDAEAVWDAVMEAGKESGIKPIGLGARDTLRLEVGYPLYGNDIDHTTTPIEAKLGWVVKLKTDKDFIGREVMARQKDEKPSRYIIGLEVTGKGFPRHGAELFEGNRKVGIVTSGSIAPALGHGVCLAFVEKGYHKVGTELEAEVRGRRIPVKAVKLPFYKDGSRK